MVSSRLARGGSGGSGGSSGGSGRSGGCGWYSCSGWRGGSGWYGGSGSGGRGRGGAGWRWCSSTSLGGLEDRGDVEIQIARTTTDLRLITIARQIAIR